MPLARAEKNKIDSGISGLLGLITNKLSYLNQAEEVRAENIANASTPGYRALDVKPFTFNDALKQASSTMYATDPRHIIPASMSGANAQTVAIKSYDTSPDKNAVDTEQEALKSSQLNTEYQLMTSIYKKFTGMMRIAVKGS
jgi:flagellar basal-body rod protein FlgB